MDRCLGNYFYPWLHFSPSQDFGYYAPYRTLTISRLNARSVFPSRKTRQISISSDPIGLYSCARAVNPAAAAALASSGQRPPARSASANNL